MHPKPIKRTDVSLIQTPEPHFIPGYTGYSPQFLYRIGDTYGTLTHKLLIDPCINRANHLHLSNRAQCEHFVQRPTRYELDLINEKNKRVDPVYTFPMLPGYTGFVPRVRDRIGKRYAIMSAEGIAESERQRLRKICKYRQLNVKCALPEVPIEVTCPSQKFSYSTSELPYSKHTPPHFLDNDHKEKWLKKGYSGHVPFANEELGKSHETLTRSALSKFLNHSNSRKHNEFAPVSIILSKKQETKEFDKPELVIYPKSTGLLPLYGGHVPGWRDTVGATFGYGSRNAKTNIQCSN